MFSVLYCTGLLLDFFGDFVEKKNLVARALYASWHFMKEKKTEVLSGSFPAFFLPIATTSNKNF